MSKDYKVGYGKPPKHSKFKQGQTGNPKGRPKGRKSMRTIASGIFNRTVTIKEDGRTRRVPYLEAFGHQVAAKALNGSTRDQIAIMKAMHDYAPDLLRESDPPTSITVNFVSAKDGKPVPMETDSDPSKASETKPKPQSDEKSGENREDDNSWLD